MAEATQPVDPPAAAAPPAEGGEEGAASTSKKAAKKAEAKAKKEAEKARRAAERDAAAAASGKGGAGPTEDLAKDNYGNVRERGSQFQLSSEAVDISLKSVEEQHVGKSVKLRGWIQNARQQGYVVFAHLPVYPFPRSLFVR